jgi:hypothetical protein
MELDLSLREDTQYLQWKHSSMEFILSCFDPSLFTLNGSDCDKEAPIFDNSLLFEHCRNLAEGHSLSDVNDLGQQGMRRRSEEKPIEGRSEKEKEKAKDEKDLTSREGIHRFVSRYDQGILEG